LADASDQCDFAAEVGIDGEIFLAGHHSFFGVLLNLT
jgi:hypothetical protein